MNQSLVAIKMPFVGTDKMSPAKKNNNTLDDIKNEILKVNTAFDPLKLDTSELKELSQAIPKDGNIDTNNAEVLATKFLRGADLCGEQTWWPKLPHYLYIYYHLLELPAKVL